LLLGLGSVCPQPIIGEISSRVINIRFSIIYSALVRFPK
jgi:hypothetical protein